MDRDEALWRVPSCRRTYRDVKPQEKWSLIKVHCEEHNVAIKVLEKDLKLLERECGACLCHRSKDKGRKTLSMKIVWDDYPSTHIAI